MNPQFNLQTITTTGAGTLKSMTPDKDGFYRGVPIAVMGMSSRNNVLYDVESMVKSMTNPNSRFYKAITGGGLTGEWGHPDLSALTPQQQMHRLMLVDPKSESHYFSRVYTEPTSDGKYTLIRADVKPCGPFGEFLIEGFADKDCDVGFSLRSMTTNPVPGPGGIALKKVIAMITYDGVKVPGYEAASKRGAVGTESMQITEEYLCSLGLDEIDDVDGGVAETIGFESITCQEVLDLLETDEITVSVNNQPVGTLNPGCKTIASGKHTHSIFHELHGRR